MNRLVSALLLVFFAVGAAWGQGLTGSISGVVKDPNGAVVPNAKVIARNVGNNAEVVTQTDGVGYYRILNLDRGNYVVSAEATGFRRTEMEPQLLTISAALRIDFALEIGQVTETVTVQGAATLVNTEDAQLGKSLVNIPVLPNVSGAAGRNPLNLVTLQAGTVTTATASTNNMVGPFAVNGQRAQANNYLLDGTDSNDLAINVPDTLGQISPNALAEFRLVTGAMKAEYGRNTGAVVEAVTRSGGNDFHGQAENVFRNTALNASNFFQNVTPGGTKDYFANGSKRKPQWNTNDYDASLSGPIIKDKTFFMVSYLGFKRRQSEVVSGTVLTAEERAIINQYGTAAAKNVANLYPEASSGDTYFGALPNTQDRQQWLFKVDHRLTAANSLAVTYFLETSKISDPTAFGGTTLPGFGTLDQTRFQNAIVRNTTTFSPSLINELRASFHRRGSPSVFPVNKTTPAELGFTGIIPDDPDAAGPPFFDLSAAGLDPVGNTYQGPQSRFDNTYQLMDSISHTRGKHAFKFGFDAKTFQQNQVFDFINNGYVYPETWATDSGLISVFPGFEDKPALNDFAHGYLDDFEQSNSGRQGYRAKFLSGFVQDDWKMKPNFTLNIGLRWEYSAPLTEVHDQVVAFRPGQVTTQFKQLQDAGSTRAIQPPIGMLYYGDPGVTRSTYDRDLNNFAPRIGLAWDPFSNGKVSVRAGYGFFYDTPISELTLQFLGNPPLGLQTMIRGSSDMTNPYPSSTVNSVPNPFPFKATPRGGTYDYRNVSPIGLTIMDPDFRNPYSQQWNLQVQYSLAEGWMMDVGYVGSSGTKLLNRAQLNPAVVTPTATSTNVDSRRIFNLANPQQVEDYGGAIYTGITDQVTNGNSIYNSLQVSLEKRLSRGLQMNHSYTWGHSIDNSSSLRVTAVGNVYDRGADRGSSDMDVRHRYVSTVIYDLPFFRDRGGFLGQTLGNWQVSSVITAQTGMPFSITETEDRALTGGVGGNRPDYIGGEITFVDPRDNKFHKQNSYFDGTGGGNSSAATSPYWRRVGTSARADRGAGRYGNFGRNVLNGPGLFQFDLSVMKNFYITERHKVTLRGEAINFLNHTNFGQPNGSIASGSFGRITSARDPRLIQLTLQYSF